MISSVRERCGSSKRAARSARRLLGAALVTAATAPAAARADDVDACASASEQGQDMRDQGHLRAARGLFVTCAAERCPSVVRKDCVEWLSTVDAKLPSVAIHARDAEGHDVTDVRVTVDGETLTERLDGRALVVDPGEHTFRFSMPGAAEVTQKLLLREGEKSRPLDVLLGGEKQLEKKPAAFSVPAASWVLGGVSVAAFAALAGFGVSASSAVDDMRAHCAPGCPLERVDAARRDMILANVALGAGALSLGTALVLVIARNVTTAAPPPSAAVKLSASGISFSAIW